MAGGAHPVTLAEMIAAHDDNALEALSSKGLVRRALRDVEAGLAAVKQRDGKAAMVIADGQEVAIDAAGPRKAKCTCSAEGVCRHVLIAVIALRQAAPVAEAENADAAEAPPQTNGPSAVAAVCGLSQAEVEAFAGADWAGAVVLADAPGKTRFVVADASCTVEIDDGAASVTFMADGLKGAAFKGPKVRKRMMVAAAALLLRAREGITLTGIPAADDAESSTLSRSFLDQAAETLARAVRMTFGGMAVVAAEALFDLAISARVESAPRLTSQLRLLARRARLAERRDVNFDAESFLVEAARCRALVEALKTQGDDPLLTGSLRRDYHPAPMADVVFLGASIWRSEAGARGLTVHGYDTIGGRWLSGTLARGPGQDPTFEPRSAYAAPIWATQTPQKIMGHAWRFSAPLISTDDALAPTLPERPEKKMEVVRVAMLREAGAAFDDWRAMKASFGARAGSGLRRRANALPVLLAPVRYGNLMFDEFAQAFEIEVYDRFGEIILLNVAADDAETAKRLREEGGRHDLVLAEGRFDGEQAIFQPIALLSEAVDGLAVVNLGLDVWARPKLVLSAFSMPAFGRARAMRVDPLGEAAEAALAAAAALASRTLPIDPVRVQNKADILGLSLLAQTMGPLATTGDIEATFRAAYVASEIKAALAWV
jgi:hypothetical protein